MKNKAYLKDFIFNYEKYNNYLNTLLNNEKYIGKIKKEKPIGYTTFNYPIDNFSIGKGSRHVLLFSTTHGSEIVTSYYILEFILTLLKDDELYEKYKNIYTFHIIPIFNPEGYIISSSNVYENLKGMSIKEIESISNDYLVKYNEDDEIAKKGIKAKKGYKTVLRTSTEYITDFHLRKSVEDILKNCNLDSSVLPIWASNGMGIDLNRNSIHKFKVAKKLSKKMKFAKLRYNDIPITKPSPIGYPGEKPFDPRCPENLALHKYINQLYNMNYDKNTKDKFIAIFSFHSTGAEIYGCPDEEHSTNEKICFYIDAMKKYSYYTKYKIIDEEIKYGVMDYYRVALKKVLALTIELSKLNGNPIGPFSDISSLLEEVQRNKIALFNTLNDISMKN